MSPQAVLRLAVRPLRGAIIDHLAPRKLSSPACYRRGINVGIYAHSQFFSTARPPPRYPRPPASPQSSTEETTSNNTVIELGPPPSDPAPEPKSQDAPSSTTPPLPEEPQQPKPSPTEDVDASFSAENPSSEPSTSPEEPTPSSSEPPSSEPSSPDSNPSKPTGELPSVTDSRRTRLSTRFSTLMDNFQSRVLVATQTINDLTGYSAIEAIKARNHELEQQHSAAQTRLREARQTYKSLTQHRASTQREVTTLLARKDTWNPTDLERFTSLYRMDHELEAQVANASSELTEAETEESKLSADLNAGILRRYHEEQIWSDRIRRQSTWGTWGLMGVNFFLFVLLQFVAEPWRRKRMIKGIAESEKGIIEEVRQELSDVRLALETANTLREQERESYRIQQQEQQQQAFPLEQNPAEPIPEQHQTHQVPVYEYDLPKKPWKEMLQEYWEDPTLLKEDLADLYSDRRITLQVRDLSVIALEGAAAGAAVAAAVTIMLVRLSRS
ncbi:Mdm33 family-domain-containing protein [Podospora fimiseda]|uniref:Sensitive to high expression protein 9, mitochondrial n=1 Tax=Podospora fimiseda TaxID=252190 RepID=A0AAN6YPU3_9PEZI|nr:Mdm33 family-domain-containing protein [Podospora fimiseda]